MTEVGRDLFQYIFSNFIWYESIRDALDKRVVARNNKLKLYIKFQLAILERKKRYDAVSRWM